MTTLDALVLGAGPAGLGAALVLAARGRPRRRRRGARRGRRPLRHAAAGRLRLRRRAATSPSCATRPGWSGSASCSATTCAASTGRWRACATAASSPGATSTSGPDPPEPPGAPDGSARGELAARFGAAFVDRVMRAVPGEDRRRPAGADPRGAGPAAAGGPGRARRLRLPRPRHRPADGRDGRRRRGRRRRPAARHPPGGAAAARRPDGGRPRRGAGRARGAGGRPGRRGPARGRRGAAGRAPRAAGRRPPRCGCAAVCIAYLAVETPAGRLTPEAWIQVDDPRVPFARAFEPVNWSPALAPAGRTVLGLECYCRGRRRRPGLGARGRRPRARLRRGARGPPGVAGRPVGRRGRSRCCASRAPTRFPTWPRSRPSAPRPSGSTASRASTSPPGSAVIEAIEAGERAARAVLAGEAGPRVDPAGVPPIS